jgi:hypothetical protein
VQASACKLNLFNAPNALATIRPDDGCFGLFAHFRVIVPSPYQACLAYECRLFSIASQRLRPEPSIATSPAGRSPALMIRGLLLPHRRSRSMARNARSGRTTTPGEAEGRNKIEKLRALRLSDEAARQAAGTWGDMSVGEIVHKPSGEIFVYSWKGRELPDLQKLLGKRTTVKRADEHAQLTEWLLKHKVEGFEIVLLAWNLSEAEAARRQQARLAERQATGSPIANATA